MSRKLKKDAKALKDKTFTGSYKGFDKTAYEQTSKALDVVIDWYNSQDLFVDYNHGDPYGPDLVEWIGFRPSRYIEVAQRSAWRTGDWPTRFDPINIEARKQDLFKLSLPCDYWIVSGDYTKALVIKHDTVVQYLNSLQVISNRLVLNGEEFITVPLSECDQVDLT
jgi:hypothetical protein